MQPGKGQDADREPLHPLPLPLRSKPLLLVVLALVVTTVVALSFASRRRPVSGLLDGHLRPCPTSPNCASSVCGDGAHEAHPLPVYGDPQSEFERLVGLTQSQPRTELLQLTEDYAHFEVSTRMLRFRSDLELHLDVPGRLIQLRSASRVGHSDFGSNHATLEHLRSLFQGRE
ncbi:MAG TPA: DUF1499 domain-containing protein [Planctomycetes bacterium]|nr:DUF1499 domain-containing protein [Planctomycetota bacterium]